MFTAMTGAHSQNPSSLRLQQLLLLLLVLLLQQVAIGSAANCSNSAESCITGTCNISTGACACPSTLVIGARCNGLKLYTTTLTLPTKTGAAVLQSQSVPFTTLPWGAGVPLGSSELATSVHICSNGYVTFDSDFCTSRSELLNSAAAPAFVAPFATTLDYRVTFAASKVTYKTINSVDGDAELKWLRDSIAALSGTKAAIVVTWENVAPPSAKDVGKTRKATIQLFLFTDFVTKTAAVMHYNNMELKDYFTWLPAQISYKTMSAGVVTLAADRQAAVTMAKQKMSVGGVQAAVKVQTVYNNATGMNYRKVCLEEEQVRSPAPSVTTQKWCPQTQQQAQRDIRFVRTSSSSSSGKSMFNMAASLSANGTNITCVYDTASGARLERDSYSSISSFSRQTFYDACCVREPSLCSRYYSQFIRPTAELYKFPNKAGSASGAGQFRSFDAQMYRFMEIGDYWLMKHSMGNVQIRMQDTNSAFNNSAAITGVAAQFMGTANLTVEVHWSMTSKRLSTVSYTINGGAAVNLSEPTAAQVNSQGAILSIMNDQMFSYTLGKNFWIEVKSGQNGLAVMVFIDGEFTSTSGLLGNNDNNAKNDVMTGSTPLPEAQLNNQNAVSTALKSWSVAAADSLFRMPSTAPTAAAGWSARYWDAAWSNATLLTRDLFAGNDTVYTMAMQACSSKNSTTTEYKNCLMEYSDCSSSTCSTAYLTQLTNTDNAVKMLTCTAPVWKASTGTEISVTEGTQYTLDLSTMTDLAAAKSQFSKLTGPANVSIVGSQLTWWPVAGDLTALAILLKDNSTDCSSVWPVKVKFTRKTGVCANSVEDFPANVYSASEVYISQCKCNTNYYTSSCSFPTCDLSCYSCNTSTSTVCSTECPANYVKETVSSNVICSYNDACTSSLCPAATASACRSVPPSQQTETFKFQCTCKPGYEYAVTGSTVNRQSCADIDECKSMVLNTCSSNQTCTNTPGSFTCACKSGFQLSNGRCIDIDECSNNTLNTCVAAQSNCVNTIGNYTCNCKAGYVQKTAKTCDNIDECLNPAVSQCQQKCTDSPGSYTCGCETGFTLEVADNKTCTANTACGTPPTINCTQICAKSGTADTCYCRDGFTLDSGDKKTCTAKTYCTSSICGEGGRCNELQPGYNCTCAQYHRSGNDGKCAKIDYCNSTTDRASVCPQGDQVTCSVNSKTNAPTCVCNTGYTVVSNTCTDVDECSNSTMNNCDSSSTICRNIPGSYRCSCRPGYKPVNTTTCQPAAYTYNVVASYVNLVFTSTMTDKASVDYANMVVFIENQMPNQLPADGTGTASVTVESLSNGSVVANASVSYTSSAVDPAAIKSSLEAAGVSGVTVATVNECLGTNDCSAEHNCVDTTSGYQCVCKSGYTKIGIRSGYPSTKVIDDCVDVNECQTMCKGDNKTCTNLPGSYTCTCANGSYSATPLTTPCEDPCRTGRCQNSGSCQYQRNAQFPYRCVCTAGYVGFHCELSDEHYWGMQRTLIIVGIVLGVLLLIALIVILLFLLRKRQQRTKTTETTFEKVANTSSSSADHAQRYRADKHRADFYQSNFSDSPVRQNAGTYKGTQNMQMSDSSIPRAQSSSQHPSSFENRGYERDQQQQQQQQRQRTDYF